MGFSLLHLVWKLWIEVSQVYVFWNIIFCIVIKQFCWKIYRNFFQFSFYSDVSQFSDLIFIKP